MHMYSLNVRFQGPELFPLMQWLVIYLLHTSACGNIKQNPILKIHRGLMMYKTTEVMAKKINFSFLILN